MESYKLFDGKITLNYDPQKHMYFIGDKYADGVTTPLSVIDKSGPLIHWAINDNALAYVFGGGKYNLAPTINPGVAYDEVQLMRIRSEARIQHTLKKEQSAGIGTLGHEVIESHIKHQLGLPGYETEPPVPKSPTLQNVFSAFLKWEQEHKVKYLYSEKKVCNPKFLYAGTLDFEAVIDGELSIGDLKTSNGIYNEFRFQTSAYLEARRIETKQRYRARWCVRVGKDTKKDQNGQEMVEFEAKRYGQEDHKRDFGAFLCALGLYRRLNELKRKKYD